MTEKNPVDIVCLGEGERTIIDLMAALEKNEDLSGVKGLWYKDSLGRVSKTEMRNSIKVLDDIPFPAWDLFPMEIYLRNPVGAPNRNKWIDGEAVETGLLSMNLYATRGCPYKCIYCYHDFMGHEYRHRQVGAS